MRRTNLTVAVILISACTSVLSAETKQPASVVEPEKSVVFDDTFQDGRLKIAVPTGSGDYGWRAGELNLKPFTQGVPREIGLLYKAAAGPVAELAAQIEFPPIDRPRGISETCLDFVLQSGSLIRVAVVRKRLAEQTTAEVRLVRVAATKDVVRVFPLPGDAPAGRWTVRYHHQLVRIEREGRLVGQGFAEAGPIAGPLLGVSVSQSGGPVRIRQLRLVASPYPPENEPQKETLQEAVRANEASMRLYQARAYPEAFQAAMENLMLFQKLRGRDHPDVAAAMINVGMVCQARQEHGEARDSFESAIEIYRKTLGEGHPQTAAAHIHLGKLLLADGVEAARTHFEAALPVYESVHGNNDPRTETLYRLLQQLPSDR